MESKKQKELIFSLIKDDLINTKLVNGFTDLGVDCSDYLLHLSETIFELIEISDTAHNEFIYKNYIDMTKRSKFIDITESHNNLDILVKEIYSYLLDERSKLKTPFQKF